jgi:hypothetical protein
VAPAERPDILIADLPPGWRHFSPVQQIEHLIGMDHCYKVLSWP